MLRQIIISVTILLLFSCCDSDGPFHGKEYTPYIELTSLEFREGNGDHTLDTLKVTIDIWDEEGDLGLSSDEYEPPYHEYDFILDSKGEVVTFSGENYQLPFYKKPKYSKSYENDTVWYSDTDNRPIYSCENYEIIEVSSDRMSYSIYNEEGYVSDTVYIKKNENFYNLEIEFYVKENGLDKELDFEYLTNQYGCGENFNGRFPSISSNQEYGLFRYTRIDRFRSRLEYSMVSAGFRITFREVLFKMKVKIRDRALNVSNEIESDYATLEDITN